MVSLNGLGPQSFGEMAHYRAREMPLRGAISPRIDPSVILSGECEAFGVELLRVEVQSTERAKVLGGTPSRIYEG